MYRLRVNYFLPWYCAPLPELNQQGDVIQLSKRKAIIFKYEQINIYIIIRSLMILKNRLMICINLNFERYLTHIFSTYIFMLSEPIFLMMNLTFLKLIFIN